MPFISQARREAFAEVYDDHLFPTIPGDKCYLFYKEMVRRWKENPCWTTAHEIYKGMITNCPKDLDDIIAASLAWQVFFNIHVMEYEQKKRIENGDI